MTQVEYFTFGAIAILIPLCVWQAWVIYRLQRPRTIKSGYLQGFTGGQVTLNQGRPPEDGASGVSANVVPGHPKGGPRVFYTKASTGSGSVSGSFTYTDVYGRTVTQTIQ